jgi:hypothetical protein
MQLAVVILLTAWALVFVVSISWFWWLLRADLKFANEELVPLANLYAREMRTVHTYWAENDPDEQARGWHAEWVKKLDVIIGATGGGPAGG